jgi:hypothetical protein
MPLEPRKEYRVPDFWSVFGHSFMQYSFGTFYQTGRADSIVRSMLDIEHTNWQNYAINGARACIEASYTGGFHRMLQKTKKPQRGGPYVADGGAALFCYGINDLGMVDNTTQVKDAYIHAMRTMISRWRAAVIYENGFQVGTRTTYGAGFASIAATGYTSGNTAHWCTDTTPDADDFFTLTLPSDYNGEPVGISLVGAGGVAGGTITWSGTAGVTGTTSVSDILPSSAVSHCPVLKRITNLTSANAGQTIIGTVTQMDSGGAVMLDGWWLEAKEAPPVIVCDITRLPAAGYTANYASWDGTESSRDQDVLDWNTALYALVAEFDSMVQVAYVDAVIQKNASYFFTDNLHPNEKGAARIADAISDAIKRLNPTQDSITASLNPSSPRAGGSLRPRISGQWYTTDYATTTTYTPVAGHLWAMPIWVTQGREFWNQLSLECSTAGSTQSTIRWGLYEDVGWSGYPGDLINEATAGGAFSITNSTGVKTSPTSGGGSINWVLDPGLYWIGFMVVTVGTSQVLRAIQGHNGVMPNCGTTGLPLAQASATQGWRLTGQGTTALPTSFPTGATAIASAPFVGVKVFINPTN